MAELFNGCTIFVLVLCSINTLLLVQLFAEFLQDAQSSQVVAFASPPNEAASSSVSTCSASLSSLPSLASSLSNWTILWHAPFFSGGGYCSEAWSYFYLLQAMGADVRVVQHGDGVDKVYVSQMNEGQHIAAAASSRAITGRIISVCHSEPGAWSAPSPRFHTSRCPHPLAHVAIGRTMFETDRLPQGWVPRLEHMHRVCLDIPKHFNPKPASFLDLRCGSRRLSIIAFLLMRAVMPWHLACESSRRLWRKWVSGAYIPRAQTSSTASVRILGSSFSQLASGSDGRAGT